MQRSTTTTTATITTTTTLTVTIVPTRFKKDFPLLIFALRVADLKGDPIFLFADFQQVPGQAHQQVGELGGKKGEGFPRHNAGRRPHLLPDDQTPLVGIHPDRLIKHKVS